MRLPLIAAILAATAIASPAFAAEREVSVDGGLAPLHATLSEPEQVRPGPAVLIIPGSGPTDRNGDSPLGVRAATLRLLAEGLAADGIRSLRYDKRGIAASAPAIGREEDMRFATAVDDAALFGKLLAAQPGVTCVILLGHSEGSLIASLAAQKLPVCGVISISGPGRPLGAVLREQIAAKAPPPDLAKRIEAALTDLEAGRATANIPGLESLFRPSVQPYLISQLTLDPAAALAAVHAPVLILQGERDLQVGVDDARRLAAARPDATLVLLPGVNHVLKSAPADSAGNAATYADPALPLAPGVLAPILAFVRTARP